MVAKVKNLVALAPVLGASFRPAQASPVEVQSLQQKQEKRRKRKGEKFQKSKSLDVGHFLIKKHIKHIIRPSLMLCYKSILNRYNIATLKAWKSGKFGHVCYNIRSTWVVSGLYWNKALHAKVEFRISGCIVHVCITAGCGALHCESEMIIYISHILYIFLPTIWLSFLQFFKLYSL